MAREFLVAFNLPVDALYSYLPPEKGECGPGRRVMAPFGSRTLEGFVVGEQESPGDEPRRAEQSEPRRAERSEPRSFKLKRIARVVDEEPLFGEGEISLARWMARLYLCSLGEALSCMLPGGRRESARPLPSYGEEAAPAAKIELSAEQLAAARAIAASAPGTASYLHGLTGSGKTEVFIEAAAAALAAGRGVIYLVPEIALTRQTVESVAGKLAERARERPELRGRFNGRVAVMHSGMTPSQRLAEWRACLAGEARVAIGARSAVFAPVRDLGLVVVDEEHEGSYKSGSSPRYHARQVALRRCKESGARLVMGSATPSLEAWKLMEDGAIQRLRLTRRLAGGAEPEVRVVDMAGTEGCFSRELAEELRLTKRLGRQSILFLNRRGFSHFYHCRSCGYELACKHCSVGLTYHRSRGRAVCHYCGYQEAVPPACPDCGSLDAGFAGFGTEYVEEEARRLLPDCRVVRVDADTVKDYQELEATLADFRAGKIDVLLGTQMVAKGLNFPGLRLVGIVLADSALHLPDFRAAERTHALIMQASGRAGRYFPDGLVIVQSLRPGNPAIALARPDRAEEFYARELAVREELGFPPGRRLIRLVARSKDAAAAEAYAGALARACATLMPAAVEVLGPSECPLGLVAQNRRVQVLLLARGLGEAHAPLARAIASAKRPPAVHLEVDVDPVSLL